MAKKKQSPALELVLHVWASACKAAPHSWERLNHTMYDAVTLAITGGLEFGVDDFNRICKTCRPQYWLDTEQAYLMAVATPNISACKAFEHCLKREPVIADNVTGPAWHHYNTFTCQRGRVAKGCTFDFRGLRPKVTSFSNGCVVACTYKPRKEGEYGDKLERRFTISREHIITDRADQKERRWILDNGREVWGKEACDKFCDALGGVNYLKARFLQLPRKRIDAALKKLGLEIGQAAEAAGGET
jgi:hypothetical protein